MTRRMKSVVAFAAMACGTSWIVGTAALALGGTWAHEVGRIWPDYVIRVPVVWGPGLAACVLVFSERGAAGVRKLFRGLQAPLQDYAWMVFLPVGGTLLAWLSFTLSGTQLRFGGGSSLSLLDLLAHFLLQFVVVGIGEEVGWRGWLLPKLLVEGKSLWGATFMTGAIWVGWHLPKLTGPIDVIGPLVLVLASSSVLFSLLWVRVRGNLLVLAMAHASVNAPIFWIEMSGSIPQSELLRGWAAWSGMLCVVAGVLAWRNSDASQDSRVSVLAQEVFGSDGTRV
jgi:CAAX protease family protein